MQKMSNDNGNSSVQSIKKKFELQILNNEKDKSHGIIKGNSKSTYNSSASDETRVKHTLHGSENNITKSVSLESCSKKNISSDTVYIEEQEKFNFAFNRPDIDPKRKSQIRRKPAFRCPDNKHNQNCDKETDNTVSSNRSFLFKHAETVDKVKKSPVISRANLEKIEKTIANPPPSVLFALMKEKPTTTPRKQDEKKSENKNPDVNHMLKRLEELLTHNDKSVKKCASDSLKNAQVDPEALKLEHIKTSALTNNKSDNLNHKIFHNNSPEKTTQTKSASSNFGNHQAHNLPNGNPTQPSPVYAISSKNRKFEPVYAEPFQFPQSCSKDIPRTSKNCSEIKSNAFEFGVDDLSDGVDKRNSAYAVTPIRKDLHYLVS